MSWAYRKIVTDNSGLITSDTDITAQVEDNRVTQDITIGDERVLSSGDINFTTSAPLSLTVTSGRNFVVSYFKGLPYNIYYLAADYEKLNVKTGDYTVRLQSIQSMFYNDLDNDSITYQPAGLGYWENSLATNAALTIDRIREGNELAPTFIVNRHGFSLGDVLQNIAGQHNNFGYKIDSVVTPIPLIAGGGTIPILFRGQSLDFAASAEHEKITNTFTGLLTPVADYEIKWGALWRTASYLFNSWISVRPVVNTHIGVSIEMRERKLTNLSGATSPVWETREKIREKYRIDGVQIAGSNWIYTLGNPGRAYTFSKSVSVGDPETLIAFGDNSLYLAAGVWQPGSFDWDILDGSDQNLGYYRAGLIDPYYQAIIDDNDGVSGRIVFNGEYPLDKIMAGADTILINRVKPDRNDFADIEGIIL